MTDPSSRKEGTSNSIQVEDQILQMPESVAQHTRSQSRNHGITQPNSSEEWQTFGKSASNDTSTAQQRHQLKVERRAAQKKRSKTGITSTSESLEDHGQRERTESADFAKNKNTLQPQNVVDTETERLADERIMLA